MEKFNVDGMEVIVDNDGTIVIKDDMTGIFNGCNSLDSLDVSSFDTSNIRNIKDDMTEIFNGCTSLDVLETID